MDAESAHNVALKLISAEMVSCSVPTDASLATSFYGLALEHPVGLAAGFDKNGTALDGLYGLGFSFVEVGTVTPRPQPGNEKPRMFRLPEDEAIINRLGFNSAGAETVAKNLERVSSPIIYGINIGKNRATPNEDAWRDYGSSAKTLRDFGHYFVINVSSPNTPGLRSLQSVAELERIIGAVRDAGVAQPIFIKVSPDQGDAELTEIAQYCVSQDIGIVATNTTLAREGLTSQAKVETGGLSGKPLSGRSADVCALIKREVGDSVPIISVGGIFNGEDVRSRLSAGASACQIYTSLIYRGTSAVRLILEEMLQAEPQ